MSIALLGCQTQYEVLVVHVVAHVLDPETQGFPLPALRRLQPLSRVLPHKAGILAGRALRNPELPAQCIADGPATRNMTKTGFLDDHVPCRAPLVVRLLHESLARKIGDPDLGTR